MFKKIIIAVATVASMAAIIPAQARGFDDGHLSIHLDTNLLRVLDPIRVYQNDWRDGRRDNYYEHHTYRGDHDHYERHDRDNGRYGYRR